MSLRERTGSLKEAGSVVIRDLVRADVAEVAVLLGQLGYPTTAERLAQRVVRLQDSAASTAVVAVASDGRVVGVASLHFLSLLTDDAPYALLTSMAVHEGARGNGIGRALVEHLAERALARGCRRLTVTTHVRRTGAHLFYERLGFELTGRRYIRALGS